jgi:predicted aspartyl protease
MPAARFHKVLLSTLLLGWAAVASADPAPAPLSPAPDAANDDSALLASATRVDRIGRILVPVMINGQGPFRFIVDSGSSNSTISPQLADTLGFTPVAAIPIMINGITGSAQVPSVRIAELQAGDFVIRDTAFPVVWAPLMAGADGILGLAGLRDGNIRVDFKLNKVVISRKRLHTAPWNTLRMPGMRLKGGLIAVAANIGGVPVRAVIDTGSERTLGNNALYEALAKRSRQHKPVKTTTVYGATSDVVPGTMEVAPTIDFGAIKISDTTITYGDFHIFQVWDLEAKPAVIIGMDVLGTVAALDLDFRVPVLYIESKYALVNEHGPTPVL